MSRGARLLAVPLVRLLEYRQPFSPAPTLSMHEPPESPGEAAPTESWWTIFVHAVRGTGGDPNRGPLERAIIILAIPMVLEMVMESVFAVVDIFFVSRLGDAAMAGVGLVECGGDDGGARTRRR